MKIYVACSAPHIEEAKRVKEYLISKGHEVTSRWIDDPNLGYGRGESSMAERAMVDYNDVFDSECIVVINRPGSLGGMHTELGMALAHGHRLILIGHRTQVFHHHEDVEVFPEVEDAL